MAYISDTVQTISGYTAAGSINNTERSYETIIHRDDLEEAFPIVQQHLGERIPYT